VIMHTKAIVGIGSKTQQVTAVISPRLFVAPIRPRPSSRLQCGP
jgi:hypothetical protein